MIMTLEHWKQLKFVMGRGTLQQDDEDVDTEPVNQYRVYCVHEFTTTSKIHEVKHMWCYP